MTYKINLRFYTPVLTFVMGLIAASSIYAQEWDPAASILPETDVYYHNVDLSGNDVEQIFDVDFQNCQRQCSLNSDCQEITYNTKSQACFLKSGGSEFAVFDGAVSVMKIRWDAEKTSVMAERARALQSLGSSAFADAQRLRVNLAEYLKGYNPPSRAISLINYDSQPEKDVAEALYYEEPAAWQRLAGTAAAQAKQNNVRHRLPSTNPLPYLVNAYLFGDVSQNEMLLSNIGKVLLKQKNNPAAIVSVYRTLAEMNPDYQKIYQKVEREFSPHPVAFNINNAGSRPEICFKWSKDLDTDVEYTDYIIAEGQVAAIARGKNLCLTGFEYGQMPHILFRTGLPDREGLKSTRDYEYDITLGDQSPSMRFEPDKYVIPMGDHHDVPLYTVNMDQVELELYRANPNTMVALQNSQSLFQNIYGSHQEEIRKTTGELIWKGVVDIENTLNKEVATGLPFADLIEDTGPGAYVVIAKAQDTVRSNRQSDIAQWFLISDLGVTSLKGNDGLHVFLNHFSDAGAAKNVTVKLISRANEVLSETTTNRDGYAHFDGPILAGTGGNTPLMLQVSKDNDFNALTLDGAGFDFSDRGVKGRAASGPVDVFVTSERGVYLPGDDVHFTILARDQQAKAVSDVPLTVKLRRPDDKVYLTKRLEDGQAGGRSLTTNIGPAQPSGNWHLSVYADPEAPALGTYEFLVENFVPERIEYDLKSEQKLIAEGDRFRATINARFLFGAPGADLRVAGRLVRKPISTLEAYPGYVFETSLHEPGASSAINLNEDGTLSTNGQGVLDLDLYLPESVNLYEPEQLTLRTEVSDSSGRPVIETLTAHMDPQHTLIGIKPRFQDAVGLDDTAKFDVIAVGSQFAQQDVPQADWKLFRVHVDYQWYFQNGEWKYHVKESFQQVDEGQIDLTSAGPAEIASDVDWGEYELRVQPDGAPVYARNRFYSGYYGRSADQSAPDRLLTALDKDSYAVGDRVRLNVESAGKATALVSVLNDHLVTQQQVRLSRGDNEISLDVTEDWGSGAYIVTSAIRPLDARESRLPQRAVGVNWVAMQTDAKKLDVAIETAKPLVPRTKGSVIVTVDGARNEEVYLTLAAVDKGILNVTNFEPPDPLKYYFAQRRLGYQMRDVYGRFLAVFNGQTGVLRGGGGVLQEVTQAPIANKQEDYLAHFSGLVTVDGSGRAEVPLDIPAFNGTARLMAIAWSNERIGSAYADQEIRDPVVVLASHPRYLARGDQSRLHLDITAMDGVDGPATVSLSANAAIGFDGQSTLSRDLVLTTGEVQTLEVPITGIKDGTGEIEIALDTGNGAPLTYKRLISVVDTRPELSNSDLVSVRAGSVQNLTLTSLTEGFDTEAQLSAMPLFLANLMPRELVRQAEYYPYGCSEQLSSSALRAVLFGDYLRQEDTPQAVLDKALDTLRARQNTAGAVGLWSRNSSGDWLQAQIVHFMTDARKAGANLPDEDYQAAVRYLKTIPQQNSTKEDGSQGAYALYTLALIGEANIGDIRYFADNKTQQFSSPLAMAQIAAALALYNNEDRAKPLFNAALSRFFRQKHHYNYRVYGSRDRELFGILYLGLTHGFMDVDAVLKELAKVDKFSPWPNTQDIYWGMRLTAALKDAGFDFDAVGASVDMHEGELGKLTITNDLQKDLVYRVRIVGKNVGTLQPVKNGFEITRSYFDLMGNPVDPSNVQLNQQLVVMLQVTPKDDEYRRLVVSDPLPAGLEIDSPHLLGTSGDNHYNWLNEYRGDIVSPEQTEFGPTYFNAFIDRSSTETFKLIYTVRAISPGTFNHYPAKVQDMYDNTYIGTTAGGTSVRVD